MFWTIIALHPPVAAVKYATIPTDAASLFVYGLLIAAGVAIWKGGRSS